MEDKTEKKCENCYFWVRDENIKSEGECRIKPPVPFVIVVQNPLTKNFEPQLWSVFPRTRANISCGKFSLKIDLKDLI